MTSACLPDLLRSWSSRDLFRLCPFDLRGHLLALSQSETSNTR